MYARSLQRYVLPVLILFACAASAERAYADPVVSTLPATFIDASSATLSGTVDPNGDPTLAWFQYSAANNFSNLSPKVYVNHIGSTNSNCDQGGGACLYSYRISGLSSNKTFYYRIGAEQETSLPIYGEVMSFTTLAPNPPVPPGTPPPIDIGTLPATAITSNSAVFHGRVNPNGYPTIGWFNYALDSGFQQGSNSVFFETIGSGTAMTDFSYSLPAGTLAPCTTYYYRAGAMHSDIDAIYSGFIQHFKTSGESCPEQAAINQGQQTQQQNQNQTQTQNSLPGAPPVIKGPVIEDTGALVECDENCDYPELIALIQRVIDFLLFTLSLPLAAALFMYAGFEYLTSGGDPGKIKTAKAVFKGVFIGLVIALAAWLIVNTVLTSLLSDDALQNGANLLKDSTGQ